MAFGTAKYTTLAIHGGDPGDLPIPNNDVQLTLAIAGYYTERAGVVGPYAVSGNISLFMAAHPSDAMPLSFVAIPDSSGNTSLYVNATVTSDPTASGWQAYATLAIPVPTSGTFHSGSFPLFVDGPSSVTATNASTLFTSGELSRINTNATIFVSGGTTSAPGSGDQNIPLFVGSTASSTGNIPLFIEKDYDTVDSITLYINHRMGSGHMPLTVGSQRGSTYISSDNIPLSIKPPASGQIILYTRGYLE